MKAITIFIIIVIAIVAYSVFEEYLTEGGLFSGFKLQANVSQGKSIGEEAVETDKPLATTPKPIQSKKPIVDIKEDIEEDIEITQEVTVDISPYYGKVKISSIQKETKNRPSLIKLRVNIHPGDKINLTGWKIKTRKEEITIPKGIEKYKSYAVPSDIIVEESLYVYLIGDSNPLGINKNFRVNKCFGYLKDYSFYPSCYSSCPRPKLEDVSHLNPYCQEYILRLPRCEVPDYSGDTKIMFDMECRNYINKKFNYRSCFKDFSKDEDFLKNYWYIYRDTDMIEPLHDTIYLYDHNGLLVDKYIY